MAARNRGGAPWARNRRRPARADIQPMGYRRWERLMQLVPDQANRAASTTSRAGRSEKPLGGPNSWPGHESSSPEHDGVGHLIETVAPASSHSALSLSASAFG